MPSRRTARATLLTVVALAMASILALPAAAQTTSTTGASVTVVDAGALDVHWTSEGVTFLVDGEAPSVTAVEGSTATATFALVVADTRATESRDGYEIRLSADPFTISGTDRVIAPELLSIASIAGLPDAHAGAEATGSTLDTPVTILEVPAGAAAVDTTIEITIAMTIPPGTYPGTFSGGIALEILPRS